MLKKSWKLLKEEDTRNVKPSKNIQGSTEQEGKHEFKMTGFEIQRAKQEALEGLEKLRDNMRLEEKVEASRCLLMISIKYDF